MMGKIMGQVVGERYDGKRCFGGDGRGDVSDAG